jgi:hypothetical protein
VGLYGGGGDVCCVVLFEQCGTQKKNEGLASACVVQEGDALLCLRPGTER